MNVPAGVISRNCPSCKAHAIRAKCKREQEMYLRGAEETANELKHRIAVWKKAPLLHPTLRTPLPYVGEEIVNRIL